ncbi:hypothetical protein Scep_002865 [Stephania cephalantha]|uniref:Uncharacterized protein n=1 Tax=Stephania cephalantha TaxID=152367 RepID=A0AAP0LFY6_9MAGN
MKIPPLKDMIENPSIKKAGPITHATVLMRKNGCRGRLSVCESLLASDIVFNILNEVC